MPAWTQPEAASDWTSPTPWPVPGGHRWSRAVQQRHEDPVGPLPRMHDRGASPLRDRGPVGEGVDMACALHWFSVSVGTGD